MAATSSTTGGVRKRVLIVGAGFAGLKAAIALAHSDVNITVVDRKNHHTFQPLLYQVAMAVLSAADIAQPIRAILRAPNTQVLMDEVTGFDTAAHCAHLKSGTTLEYDYLVLATGSTHSYFGKEEQWSSLAPGLKTIEDAIEIRRRVLLAFEKAEGQMLENGSHPALNFVVIGGGPTGVELAGAISDIAKLYIRKDFRHIDPASAKVFIIEGSPDILSAYPPDLRKSGLQQLEHLGVVVRTGQRVTDVQPGYVMIGSERIDAVVTLWAAGVQPSPLGKLLGVPLTSTGNVIVDDHLHPEGHPEIFVCGDLAHATSAGEHVPGVAQPAMQMGDYAGRTIKVELEGGRMKKPFHYFDKGDMATIGRASAIANVKWPFKAHMSGFLAWCSWLVVHIFFLIGFRNRFSVFRNWAFTYLFFEDGVRLITGAQDLPGWKTPVNAVPVAHLSTHPAE